MVFGGAKYEFDFNFAKFHKLIFYIRFYNEYYLLSKSTPLHEFSNLFYEVLLL